MVDRCLLHNEPSNCNKELRRRTICQGRGRWRRRWPKRTGKDRLCPKLPSLPRIRGRRGARFNPNSPVRPGHLAKSTSTLTRQSTHLCSRCKERELVLKFSKDRWVRRIDWMTRIRRAPNSTSPSTWKSRGVSGTRPNSASSILRKAVYDHRSPPPSRPAKVETSSKPA